GALGEGVQGGGGWRRVDLGGVGWECSGTTRPCIRCQFAWWLSGGHCSVIALWQVAHSSGAFFEAWQSMQAPMRTGFRFVTRVFESIPRWQDSQAWPAAWSLWEKWISGASALACAAAKASPGERPSTLRSGGFPESMS